MSGHNVHIKKMLNIEILSNTFCDHSGKKKKELQRKGRKSNTERLNILLLRKLKGN